MKRSLTPNERAVLHGLVSRPTLNDRELSETLSVKVSTVTAIRRRLRRVDFFVARRIPMMHRLGWEILVAGLCRLPVAREADAAARMREALGSKHPTFFHVIQAPDHFVFLAQAPTYTAFARDLEVFRASIQRAGLSDGMALQTAVFPLALTCLVNFFDFGRILSQAFGFEDSRGIPTKVEKVGDLELTRKEQDVLKGLVRFPEFSDKAVAAKIKASRQAVSKMRRDFHERGLLRTVRLPDLRALGFELVGAAFVRYPPQAGLKVRAAGIEKVARAAPLFFHAVSNSDAVMLGGIRTYEEVAKLRASLGQFAEEQGLAVAAPETAVGLASMTDIPRNCDFSAVVQML